MPFQKHVPSHGQYIAISEARPFLLKSRRFARGAK
jgi:hypothetical protein